MSRTFLKIACALCVIGIVVCGAVILGKTIRVGSQYANAEKYTAGETTINETVKNLDIDWVDGAVNIAYHAQDTVEIAETAPKAISADAALRWWLDGDTLRVRYAKSGLRMFRSLDKTLTVTLPEGVALGEVRIDTTSGDVNVPDLVADDILVDMTSGDLALKQSGAAARVALSSTSGRISADVSDVEKMAVSATSGDIRIAPGSVKDLSVSSTSGGVTLDGGEAQKASIDTTSGGIAVRLTAFNDLNIDATSGDVTAALPSEPGYIADIDTTSGRFDYTVALAKDGGKYVCGDGSAKLRVETTSGNVRLEDVH